MIAAAYFLGVVVFVGSEFERLVNLVVLEQFADGREDAAEPEQSKQNPHTDAESIPRPVSDRRVLACSALT